MLSFAINRAQLTKLARQGKGSLGHISLPQPSAHVKPQRYRQCLSQLNTADNDEQKVDRTLAPPEVTFQLLDSSTPSTSTSSNEFQYDEETKTMKVQLSALQGEGATRRTRLVTFTCNKCDGRTTRAVNP